MSFLRSIAADFLEKRLWPIAAVLGAALIVVLGYAALSGGSGAAPVPSAVAPVPASGVSVTSAPANPNEAVSETTTGARYQRQAGAHDPFVPLGAGSSSAASGSPSGSGATGGSSAGTPVTLAKGAVSASGGSASRGSTSGGSAPAPASSPPATLTPPASTPTTAAPGATKPGAPSAGAKLTTHPVAVRFGAVPTTTGVNGTTQQGAPSLVTHNNLARLSPLPDAKSPIVVYMGTRVDGKTATFALVHEAILRGDGACRPSTLHCQLLDLKAGQKEQLDYVTPDLSVVRYELDVTSVGAAKTAAAAATRFFHRESASGRDLLKSDFPPGVGTLTYSYATGSLQTAPAAAAAARAHKTVTPAPEPKGSPAYAPPLPHAGQPVVQPGWLDALLHAL